jgi:hypothetical protein
VIGLACAGAIVAAGCGGRTNESSADAGSHGASSGSGGSSGSTGSGSGGSAEGGTDTSSGAGGSSSGSFLGDGSSSFDAPTTVSDGATGSFDATVPDASSPLDATFDVTPPPTGQAGFALIVNGAVQIPMSCPADNWEFPPLPAFGGQTSCNVQAPPCSGITSALLVNTGQVPLAYTAKALWSNTGYPPGVQFGEQYELSGVVNPADEVDITSVFLGGIVAVLGSSEPFSDGSHYVSDEGTIAWPAGVAGSGGATQMYVAEINFEKSCQNPTVYW